MRICSGLVGPKSENVEKVLVLNAFLKVSREAWERQAAMQRAQKEPRWSKRRPKQRQKEGNRASRHEMASMMHICSGLVGPKSENVEKSFVFKAFLKGQGSKEHPRRTNKPSKRCSFFLKNLQKKSKKIPNELLDMRWQVWCVYVRAWWGPKAEMLKNHWFLKVFLKGQEGHE